MSSNASTIPLAGAHPVEDFTVTPAYRHYVVWLLFAVYLFSYMDRLLLSGLMEQIKQEFAFSDVQLGLLNGTAFGIFYTILGLPLGRFADRTNRTRLIAISLISWSLFTTATGFAKNFVHLFLARMGVAVGEAGCNPAAYSIISDYVEPKRRATSLAIYNMGSAAGGFLGLMVVGYVGQNYGWRTAFMVVGLPGVLVAIVLWLTLREPPRGLSEEAHKVQAEPPAMWLVLKHLLSKPSFRHLAAGTAIINTCIYAMTSFYSSFFQRCLGFSLQQASYRLAAIYLVGGVIGIYLGGALSDRMANEKKDPRYFLWIPGIAFLLGIPFNQYAFMTGNATGALLAFVPAVAFASCYLAPSITATYQLVGVRERAVASAGLLLILNLIGISLGSPLAGLVSDSFKNYFMEHGISEIQAEADGLRWSLRLISLLGIWAALHFFLAARKLRADIAKPR